MQDGRLQIYTGDGKGKTTASIGLAIRAAGAGFRVAFLQFDKGHREGNEHYAERKVLRTIPNLDLRPTGLERMNSDGTFRFGVTPADLREAARGLDLAEAAVSGGEYDVVILDDVIGGLGYGLIERSRLDRILELWRRERRCELVLTGREAPADLVAAADLVTEMRKVKHYFDAGLAARPGIEY